MKIQLESHKYTHMMGNLIVQQVQFLLEKMNLRQNSYRQVEGVRWSKRVRVTDPLMSLSPACLPPLFPCLSTPLPSLSSSLSPLFPASLSPVYLSPSSLPLSLHPSSLSLLSFTSVSFSLSSISLPSLFLSSASFFPVPLRALSLPPRSPHVPVLCLPPSVAISSFTLSLSLIILLCLFLIFTLLIPL